MRQPRKRQHQPPSRPHGWIRREDGPTFVPVPVATARRQTLAGTSVLLALVVIALTTMAIIRIRSSIEVLALGAEIAELTAEQSRLLETRRRLAAEVAYLRHPRRIKEFAREQLGMVPVAPELIQTIRVEDDG